jgi:hypothetical protein
LNPSGPGLLFPSQDNTTPSISSILKGATNKLFSSSESRGKTTPSKVGRKQGIDAKWVEKNLVTSSTISEEVSNHLSPTFKQEMLFLLENVRFEL